MAKYLYIAALATALSTHAEEQTDTTTTLLQEVEIAAPVLKENGALRQQPIATTLLDDKQLAAHQATSLKGASTLVPNMFIPDYGSHLTSAIYIRGVGNRINTPTVGLYVDNIPYIDKSAFDFNLCEIERVDVLRGPQGTLYGRNTMGGLVRIYTKNPFFHNGTDVRLSYATGDNHRTASLTHYHRVNQQLAFSAGGYYEGSSGFFQNDFTGQAADGLESGGGRFRAIYKPTSRLSVDFTASYDYSDEGAYPYYYLGSPTQQEDYPTLQGLISNNRRSSYRRSLLNTGVNVQYQADGWQMNAITGFQNLRDRMYMDQDFLQPDIYTLEQSQRINTINEELTFKSTRHGRLEWISGVNLMYQALRTKGPVNFYADGIQMLQSNINRVLPDLNTIPMLKGMGFEQMAVNFRDGQLLMDGTYQTPTFEAALFHQSTLNITDQWHATLGLRLNYEHQQMRYLSPADVNYGFTMTNPSRPFMGINLQDLHSHIVYEGLKQNDRVRLLPRVSVQYDINNIGNLYASVAMGQRAGGYNLQMFSDLLQGAMRHDMMQGVKEGVADYMTQLSQQNPMMPATVVQKVVDIMEEKMPTGEVPNTDLVIYKPEYSINYEIGTHLNPCQRLQLDASLFYSRIYDQQIARFAPTGFGRMMTNAGRSESYGAEVALRWQPTRNLYLSGNYGYTHAQFKRYEDGNGQDYAGKYVPFVPMHTLMADAAYTWFVQGNSHVHSLTLGANCTGNGRIQWTEANTHSQPFYALLGARLSLETTYFTATLWAKNLTDTRYTTFYFESASRAFEQRCKPMQFGIDLSIHL